jgi:hypothetical protein
VVPRAGQVLLVAELLAAVVGVRGGSGMGRNGMEAYRRLCSRLVTWRDPPAAGC